MGARGRRADAAPPFLSRSTVDALELDWAHDRAACMRTLATLAEPVVLRGGAAGLAAARGWSPAALAAAAPAAPTRVRVAPGPSFPVTEPSLVHLWVTLGLTPPSRVAELPLAEAVARLARECPLPPLFFGNRRLPVAGADAGRPRQEWYYLQTPVSAAFAYQGADDGFVPLPVSGSQPPLPPPDDALHSLITLGAPVAQPLRLWLSPGGAVSPAHADASPSALAQVFGAKEMLFWEPGGSLGAPYPDWHVLRRRFRADPTAAFGRPLPRALRARLGPGDAVAFPPGWPHWARSATPSASVTRRVKRAGVASARARASVGAACR
jgi:hypothetical protein